MHDDVQPGEGGVPHHGAVVDREAAEGAAQDLLGAQPDLRREQVAGQVDQAGDVTPVVVGADEEPHLLALGQPEHRQGDRGEPLRADLEQLLAREALEDLDEAPSRRGCRLAPPAISSIRSTLPRSTGMRVTDSV